MAYPEEMTISSEIEKTERLVFPGQFKEYEKKENYLVFKVSKKFQISIYKPLITLKLALFLWFSASVSAITFFAVFFKQRGFSVDELSLMYIVSPILLFAYTALLGVLADKIGQTKSILQFNILLNAIAALCFISMPNIAKVPLQSLPMYCHSKEAETLSLFIETTCGTENENIFVRSCNLNYSTELDFTYDNTKHYGCKLLEIEIVNRTLSKLPNNNNSIDNCRYGVSVSMKVFTPCEQLSNNSCSMTCEIENNYNLWVADNRTLLLISYMMIHFVFLATYANIFRFFDITAVALFKEHNSTYGQARFWSTLGSLFGPVLSGCVIQLSKLISGEHNYDLAFYIFISFLLLLSIVVCKTDIRGKAPCKQMWIKALILIKNPDVLIFVLMVTVMGTVWGFQSLFKAWYLEGLGADPVLIGSVETMKGISGLPFLMKSKWIVSKLGYTNLFILAIAARIAYSFAYSFLTTAWPALFIEITGIFGFHLFWVGVICYAEGMAPEGLTATVLSVIGGIHFTIGRITGSVIGGTIMSKYGGKSAFQVLGAMTLSLLMIFSLYTSCKSKKSETTETTIVKG